MSNENTSSTGASDRESTLRRMETVTVELLGIGAATAVVGAVLVSGVVPGAAGFERGLGAVLVGSGVGVGLYGVNAVQRSAALLSLALGSAFVATALVLYTGIWAAMLFVWGVAMLAVGVGAYGFVSLSRRGTQG